MKIAGAIITTVASLLLSQHAHALIGYDCGGKSTNITTISLLDIDRCDIPDVEPVRSTRYIQLLQLSDYDTTQVQQCKVEVDRTIYYCGMHSHNSVVHNGRREYILELNREACQQIFATGILALTSSLHVTDLKVNHTQTRSVTLAGNIGVDGSCHGTQYSDPFGTWNDVVVQASLKITIQSYQATIKSSSNQLTLRSGTRCELAEGHCLDSDGGNTFWSPAPTDSCRFDQYDVLYEGWASKLYPKDEINGPTVYTVTTKETTFALLRTTEFPLCGYTVIRTEHPKLFVVEAVNGNTFKAKSILKVDRMDIFAYVNSKFIYVERHIRTQMVQLYQDLMKQKCALEEQVLRNALALASNAPDEMALLIMKEPGHIATQAGEVLHILKCIPVTCKIRRTEKCYQELPVTYQNQTWFLTPKSRILTRRSTPRECNDFLPIMYKLENTWYRFLPKPVETKPPPNIQPLSHSNWKYENPEYLASSGIYTTEELEQLRDHIMFPLEKPAMLETLAKGAMGATLPRGSISMFNLLDEDSLHQIAESTGKKIWSGFIYFGSASAGVLSIFIIFRVVKLIVDTLIHGYALHSVYGWSLQLLGAAWSSVTHLLLHLAGRDQPAAIKRNNPSAPTISIDIETTVDVETVKKAEEPTYADLSNRLANRYA